MKKPLLALASLVSLMVGCVDSDRSKASPDGSVDGAADVDASVSYSRPLPTQTEVCGSGAGDAGDGGACPGLDDPVNTTTMAKAMGFGTNIGNTLENTSMWETGWGQPIITRAYINGMASRGIKTVRVPVAWDTYASNGVIDPSKMARVREVVGWILTAGMYAVVNIHWDGGWIFNEKEIVVVTDGGTAKRPNPNKYRLTDDVKAKFAGYWEQISEAFADVGHMLIFEGLNEEAQFYAEGNPGKAPDIAALNQLNQLFVSTVRAQGGYNFTRALLIAGFATDLNKTCVDAFTVPTDPAGPHRLFLSIHYYDPPGFTMLSKSESWGSPTATWGTDNEKKLLENQFTKLANFSAKKQIPVILGEFAVTPGSNRNGDVVRQSASRILWMESVIKACLSRGMVPLLWDCGVDISRKDGSFSSDLQAVMADISGP